MVAVACVVRDVAVACDVRDVPVLREVLVVRDVPVVRDLPVVMLFDITLVKITVRVMPVFSLVLKIVAQHNIFLAGLEIKPPLFGVIRSDLENLSSFWPLHGCAFWWYRLFCLYCVLSQGRWL